MEQVKTLVSVIIPSFKMGQFIGEALEFFDLKQGAGVSGGNRVQDKT